MCNTTIREGILRVLHPGTRWLSTGWNGGFVQADAAYNMSVPTDWDRTDIDTYTSTRLAAADFTAEGPVLLTGVSLDHARGARSHPVVAYATVGLSNPADLPVPPPDEDQPTGPPDPGTVNVIVWTARSLDDAGLATLLAVTVEARTTTLLNETGIPGTTTDATIVGCNQAGDPVPFTGSATSVGAAARSCVREAVRASLQSRYPNSDFPDSVTAAAHGISTTDRAEVFTP